MAVQRRGWSTYLRRDGALISLACAAVVTAMLAGCGAATDDSKLPPDVQDPATLKTPSGAVARYRGALSYLGGLFDRVMTVSAIITDELADLPTSRGVSGQYTAADSRVDLSGMNGIYNPLHRVRAQAREARGFLAAYAPDSSPALQGHLYAVEGYAELWLADLFCSGIPLSTVDFDGNYTLAPGSTTNDVYRHAAALFDSALTLTSDSVRVQQLAAVGKSRALLALGQFADAAAAVMAVPDDFAYQVPFRHEVSFINPQAPSDSAALWFFGATYGAVLGTPTVANREGSNGLDYRSSSDPRTAVLVLGTDVLGDTMYFPVKYPQFESATSFTLASGVEARLIEAEAALHAGSGEWLTKLNALRTDGTYDTQPNASDPSQIDTLWHPGTGGVAGLHPLADPVDPKARVDLVFRERAFWLFLTGHRQGDLRRLIRLYSRAPDQVYPTGTYPGGNGMYGQELVLPTPPTERELNSKYTGCFHYNA